jgi:CubicO group peptidase (beta-lactamase class C family)
MNILVTGAFALLFLTSTPALGQDVASKTAEYMDAAARVNHFSGDVLIGQDGKIVFEHAYGMADREKGLANNVDTKFRTASITKMFTAVAVLILRDRGKLRLDDSVCLYLDACPEPWRTTTLHQLLTHSSGITDNFDELTEMRRQHKSPADFVEAIKKHPPSFPPGTRYLYSNSGYIILGSVIAKASGMSYAAFLQKEIFKPLKMKDTEAEIATLPGEAVGYSWDAGTYRKVDMLDVSGISAASMVCSTVGDLFRFVEALENGALLKPASAAQIWTAQVDHFSYGWRIDQVNGRKRLTRGGEIEGFSNEIDDYPDQHLLVISLSNVGSTSPSKMIGDLAAIALGDSYKVPHERHYVELSQASLNALVGTYRLASGGKIIVSTTDRKLMLAPGGGQAVECMTESALMCFLAPIDDDVSFIADSSGKVTGIRMGSQMQGLKETAAQ